MIRFRYNTEGGDAGAYIYPEKQKTCTALMTADRLGKT